MTVKMFLERLVSCPQVHWGPGVYVYIASGLGDGLQRHSGECRFRSDLLWRGNLV